MSFLDDALGGLYDAGSNFWNFISGDPKGVKASYDQALGVNEQSAKKIQDLLAGGQQKALSYYTPIQDMFKNAYGQGLKPPGVR